MKWSTFVESVFTWRNFPTVFFKWGDPHLLGFHQETFHWFLKWTDLHFSKFMFSSKLSTGNAEMSFNTGGHIYQYYAYVAPYRERLFSVLFWNGWMPRVTHEIDDFRVAETLLCSACLDTRACYRRTSDKRSRTITTTFFRELVAARAV